MAFKFRKKNDDKKMLFPPLYVAFEIMQLRPEKFFHTILYYLVRSAI